MFATQETENCAIYTILEIKSAPAHFRKGPTRFIVDLLFLVSSAEDIIHADLVIVRQGAEYVRRHHALAALIISVGALRHIDGLAHLLLC